MPDEPTVYELLRDLGLTHEQAAAFLKDAEPRKWAKPEEPPTG